MILKSFRTLFLRQNLYVRSRITSIAWTFDSFPLRRSSNQSTNISFRNMYLNYERTQSPFATPEIRGLLRVPSIRICPGELPCKNCWAEIKNSSVFFETFLCWSVNYSKYENVCSNPFQGLASSCTFSPITKICYLTHLFFPIYNQKFMCFRIFVHTHTKTRKGPLRPLSVLSFSSTTEAEPNLGGLFTRFLWSRSWFCPCKYLQMNNSRKATRNCFASSIFT